MLEKLTAQELRYVMHYFKINKHYRNLQGT